MSFFQNRRLAVACFFLTAISFAGDIELANCQQTDGSVQDYLGSGEFSSAIRAADGDDAALRLIASNQWNAGADSAALLTATQISNDQQRFNAINALVQGPDDPGFGGGAPGIDNSGNGAGGLNRQGGITQADFNQLIQLVQNNISTDTWQANGSGNGTIQAYPAGVYVDANGTLNRIKKSKRKFSLDRDLTSGSALPGGSITKASDMRKVSLTRLEKAIQIRAAAGLDPDEAMRNLAGLTEIQYVMVDPEAGEVIIAGPAAGWKRNRDGKVVSTLDNDPVLNLDDLVVCLRNAYRDGGKFGCSIVPRKENLAATQEYISSTSRKGRDFQNGLRDVLGQQDIEVSGIPSNSHAARVIVEADYHMKLLGMGIEPSIRAVPGYLERVKLDANGNPPPMDVVRWWFALNYEQLIANESKTLFEFRGPGVKVLAETELLGQQGQRIHTGKAVGPTADFARDFTDHYEALADIYPIYNELKNVFDLAIVANLIHEYDLNGTAKWEMPFLLSSDAADATSVSGGIQIETFDVAETVESVINRHVIRQRGEGETLIHTLIGVSGGVSFDAGKFVDRKNLATETDVEFTQQLPLATESRPQSGLRWWWD